MASVVPRVTLMQLALTGGKDSSSLEREVVDAVASSENLLDVQLLVTTVLSSSSSCSCSCSCGYD
jgi:hypothetical protein